MNEIRILNTNHGSSNIVDTETIDEIMYNVIYEIGELLKAHCGPYGDFAMIAAGPENPTDPPKFTKDGIHIIDATEFMNPIERQTKDLMAHIGSKVEKAAGDGTTSSMLIANLLIYKLRSYLRQNPFVNYQQFTEGYTLFIEAITDALNKIAIKADCNDSELVSGIAYNQSMTSSHGDKELSVMVAKLLSSLPKSAWDYQIFERESRESADRYSIVIDDSSYSMGCNIGSVRMYNNTTSTEFNTEGADLCLVATELISNSGEFDELKMMMDARKEGDPPLVVITAYNNDVNVSTYIGEKFEEFKRRGIEFCLFRVIIQNPNVNDLVSLFSTVGLHRHKLTSLTIIKDVKVSYKNDILYLYNLVEYDENGNHPDLAIPQSPINTTLYVLEEFVANAKEIKNMSQQMILNAKRMINCLKSAKIGYIKIGGTGYDNQSSVDILQDVLCATRESLTKGVVLGGYKSLRHACKIAYPEYTDHTTLNSDHSDTIVLDKKINTKAVSTEDICLKIAASFIECIDELLYLLYVEKCPHSEAEVSLPMDTFSFDVISGIARAFSESSFKEKTEGFIVSQPITTDIEFIKRFGEVATKFLFTHRVIIPGTASIKNND